MASGQKKTTKVMLQLSNTSDADKEVLDWLKGQRNRSLSVRTAILLISKMYGNKDLYDVLVGKYTANLTSSDVVEALGKSLSESTSSEQDNSVQKPVSTSPAPKNSEFQTASTTPKQEGKKEVNIVNEQEQEKKQEKEIKITKKSPQISDEDENNSGPLSQDDIKQDFLNDLS